MRQLGKRVDIAVSPELKAKELEKKMTYSNDCSGERPLIDAPIRSSAEDDLGRAPVAHAFARSILELDASQGLVVAVMGPWGHGKSSFINLMREEFEGIPKESDPTPEESKTRRALTVIDFNPWMFSGSDQLVDFFFTQIGAELKVKNESRLGKIADWLGQYAGILKPAAKLIPLPGASAVGEVIAAGINGLAGTTSADRSVQEIKDDITKALSKLEEPIVVVIDDIDRLTKIEIREIFKLVRLTASFPNIIYLLAFDRERVEQALSEDGISGRAYLEKIVLLSFDIPQASEKLLRSRTIAELERVLSPITNATLDEHRWASAYLEVIEPLLSNIRDVTRYAISAKQTIKDLGDKVDLVDLLAMEALRVFRPEIFRRLPTLRNELAGAGVIVGGAGKRTRKGIEEMFKDSGDEGNPSAIESLLNEFPGNETVVALLAYVFPASQHDHMSEQLNTWRTERRMAHIDFLNLYFDRVMPDSLVAFRYSECAVNLLNDRRLIESYLTKLPPETLEDAIDGLASYETKFTDDMVIPGSITLLNLIDTISKKKRRSLFDIAGGFAVRHVVIALLHRVDKEEEREKFVSQILEGLETYSSKLYLIETIRYSNLGEKGLVSETFAEQIYADFVQTLQNTPPNKPSREWNAGPIYYEVAINTGEAPLSPSNDPVLLQSVLYSLRFTTSSQSLDPLQDQSKDRLDWDKLVKLFGSEDKVRTALLNIREKLGDDEVFRLADRYLQGWEPDPS
ncbi:KAP family P-loop NTPase fold protein [Peptidiphaga gingivicola]|nr:P-loop NTPase fold protein [Peptidiphaga gingivicola]